MKMVIQRVTHAEVAVEGKTVGAIGQGFLVLLGVGKEDNEEIAEKYVAKLTKLRIFEDEEGKTNLNLAQVDGEVLVISQFTLYANCRKGNRPSFVDAGDPAKAEALYEYVVAKIKEAVPKVETGIFGAYMDVSLTNDGPFTVILEGLE